jgi:drug/metabolite transporter (DMT)-like permease
MSMQLPASFKGPALMIFAVTAFAGANTCVKMISEVPITQVILVRALISLVICSVMMRQLGLSFKGNNPKLLILRGVFGTISLTLFFYTLQVMPLATAVSVQYLSPLFTVLFATFMVKERASLLHWVCFFIAIIGVIIAEGFDPAVLPFEAILGLISAMASGVAYNLIRVLRTTDHALTVMISFPIVTIPIIGPVAVWQWVELNQVQWLWMLGVGIFTHFGQLYMTKAFQAAPAKEVSLYMYSAVILAGAIGYFVFNERLSLATHFGLAMIGIAMLLPTLIIIKTRPKASL